jgi:hypothetical protein
MYSTWVAAAENMFSQLYNKKNFLGPISQEVGVENLFVNQWYTVITEKSIYQEYMEVKLFHSELWDIFPRIILYNCHKPNMSFCYLSHAYIFKIPEVWKDLCPRVWAHDLLITTCCLGPLSYSAIVLK